MPTIKTTIGHSTLIGILVAGNRNGLLVPHIILDEELEHLRTVLGCPVTPLNSKLTALGNLILTNDHAALVSTEFGKPELQVIRDTLGVEVEPRTVARSDLVGSYCVVTNRGLLAHAEVSEDELSELGSFFAVNPGVGTINCGVPYVSIGLLAASHAAAAGFETTGPELMRITETFFPE
jgi:translation initiation factor 6